MMYAHRARRHALRRYFATCRKHHLPRGWATRPYRHGAPLPGWRVCRLLSGQPGRCRPFCGIQDPIPPACVLRRLKSQFHERTIQDANAGGDGWLPLRQKYSTLIPVSAPLSFCVDFWGYFFRYDEHAAKPGFQLILHLLCLKPRPEIAYVHFKIGFAITDVGALVGETFLEFRLRVISRLPLGPAVYLHP